MGQREGVWLWFAGLESAPSRGPSIVICLSVLSYIRRNNYIYIQIARNHPYPFGLVVLGGMAPKVKLTAAPFHERYGNLVSEHFAQHTTAYTLRIALSQRQPPIIVTDGMLKIRFAKFRLPSDAVTVSSAEELH